MEDKDPKFTLILALGMAAVGSILSVISHFDDRSPIESDRWYQSGKLDHSYVN
jgi:hypothetical protein